MAKGLGSLTDGITQAIAVAKPQIAEKLTLAAKLQQLFLA